MYGFRIKKFAVSGDIKAMFHQIRIREKDQRFQRFLWRNNEVDRSPDVYSMQVMTFDAARTPCSSQYVENCNAKQFADFREQQHQLLC